MSKYFITLGLLLLNIHVYSQLYFTDNFEVPDYTQFKFNSLDKNQWTFFHSENQDFNGNHQIDKWENIKSIDFIEYEPNNEAIRFQLRRMDYRILWNDVMVRGEIDGNSVDYHNFFTHIARNEISTWDDPNRTAYKPNKKYQFEFDMMIPEDFEFEHNYCENPSNANYDLTGQWHFSYDVRNGNTMSPVSLRVVCDQWMLNLNPNNDSVEHDEDFIPLGKIEKGKWIHWKFQFKFSHKKKGFVHVWKDDVLVLSKKKIKTIFAKHYEKCKKPTVYFKIGVYKPHWWSRTTDTRNRIYYYDNVKVSK